MLYAEQNKHDKDVVEVYDRKSIQGKAYNTHIATIYSDFIEIVFTDELLDAIKEADGEPVFFRTAVHIAKE